MPSDAWTLTFVIRLRGVVLILVHYQDLMSTAIKTLRLEQWGLEL